MTPLSEEKYHPKIPREVAEKLNISEQVVINWRRRALNVPEADPEEKNKHRAGGSIPKPEEILGQIGKQHYSRIRVTAKLLGISEQKTYTLLKSCWLDGINLCKLRTPEKTLYVIGFIIQV